METPVDETPVLPIEPVIVIAASSTPEIDSQELIEIPKEEPESVVVESADSEPVVEPKPEIEPTSIESVPVDTAPESIESAAEEPVIEAEPEQVIPAIIVPDRIPGSVDSLMPEPIPQLEEILLPEDEIIEQENFQEPIIIIAEPERVVEQAEALDTLPVESATETAVEEPVIIIAETPSESATEDEDVSSTSTPEPEVDIPAEEPIIIAATSPETPVVMEVISPEAETNAESEVKILVDEPIIIAEAVSEEPAAPVKPEQPLIVMAEPAPNVTARYVTDTAYELKENILTAGISLETSAVHTYQSTEYESSYLKTAAEPWINYNNFSMGLHFSLMFEDYPLSIANWYLPRGNNPYDFGTGYSSLSSFAAIRDLSLDILSLIGYANYRSPAGSFLLNADDHTAISMGTGALLTGLDPKIDNPFVRRVGFKNTLATPYFDYELLINDLTHAELFGLRLAAKPMGQSFPLEIGLYAISDISLSPNKFVIVPGIDVRVPAAYSEVLSLTVYADFSLLMLADDSGFTTDALFTDGYLAVVGARGKSRALSFGLSGSYQNAMLTQGMFGTDYAWRRAGLITEFFDDTPYTGGGRWAISAELGYDWGIVDAQMSYRFNFDENFGVSSWDGNRDEISFSAVLATEPLTVTVGFRQRGFASSFSPDGPSDLQEFLFNERTQLVAGATYTNGNVTVNAELSGSAQYQAPDSSAVLNNIDNQLADSENSLIISPTLSIGTKISVSSADQNNTAETSVIESSIAESDKSSNFGIHTAANFFHPFFDQLTGVYDGPYTQIAISPYYTSDNFTLSLNAAFAFNGNPLSIANWYLPRGNNPYDFGTGYSSLSSFAAIRDLSLDILSLIGYANYRSPAGSFLLNADDHTAISMGTGALLTGLDPKIDNPFVRRVGFKNTLATPYFDYELLINDLTHAELFGLRLAAKPMGQSFPLEIGLYAISDISLSPNKFVIVPGIDVRVPAAYSEVLSLTVYADFSLLMLADDSGFTTDALFTDGYLAVVGARGKSRALSFGLSGSYQNAMLTQGMFGTDYAWRRAGLITEFFDDTPYTGGGRWAISAELGYDWGIVDAQMSYRFNFDENFGVSSWDGNRDEISFSAVLATEPLTVTVGFRQRGFASSFSPDGPSDLQEFLFNERTQLVAGATYTNGNVTVNAELSGSAQYQAPDSSAVLNNIDNQLADSEGSLIISPTLSIGTKIKLF